LREGQNREIRRMLARVGLKVRELERVAIGPLRAGDLKPGQAKLLSKKDVERLRASTPGDEEASVSHRAHRAHRVRS
jgi:23S rRNA pseudouridine2605 synthase